MKGRKERFLHEVLLNIRSKEAKEFVHRELSYHLKQSKAEMVSKGKAEEEAEEQAVRNMGSPSDLGQHFNKLYRPRMDWVLLGLFMTTILMGLLPLVNVQEQYTENFLLKQSIFIVLGAVVAFGVMHVNYRKTEKLQWHFLGFSLIILLALSYMPTGRINGESYIQIAGFTINGTTVLPILMMFWASYLSREKPKLLVIIGVYVFTVYLFMLLPSLTDLVIYSVFVFALFCSSSLSRKIIYSAIGTGFGLITAFMLLFWFGTKEYQRIRILAFLHPEDYAENAGYMYLKIKELITGGGWYGNDQPIFLPEMTTDLALANITYYNGWILAGLLIAVLSSLLARMLVVSGQIKDRYGKQLMVGVCALFSIQFLYNIGMVLGFLPIITISLPFISYGMTPTILNSFLIGIALNVYRRKNLVNARKI
ncbi:FtsW/RodA/SpoVE family cell cycle protein [Mesobacillus foraminis]|uniref:Cell division protein FtsW (Lipid II flippase) n=1 Tax=Mesobacillus foraminis TaxID=279826 RepID=A0A4R2BGR2_9BACI|nr:FtsW/RodA/SpoVE family cell cycle protein [Mesobacillus foraminis]TCN25169.1 cell division protein FtsW (lipid II flippase) [Mesobacillus foraminis]